MIAKTFEIRDAATFIPALAVKLEPGNEQDRYLLNRAGYALKMEDEADYVVLWRLEGGDCDWNIFDWSNRTMRKAHQYIRDHFDDLKSGSVIDVEYILGISSQPKESESKEGT